MVGAIGNIELAVENKMIQSIGPSFLSRGVAAVQPIIDSVQAIFSRVIGPLVHSISSVAKGIVNAIPLPPEFTIIGAVLVLGLIVYKVNQLAHRVPENRQWSPRVTTIAQAERKMEKNALKAIVEHGRHENVYATVQEVEASRASTHVPLSFSGYIAQRAKYRDGYDVNSSYIEDDHFYTKIPEGIIFGVLDGHGGDGVSRYVASEVPKRFSSELRRAKGNVHQAFEFLLGAINDEVFARREYDRMGTTAVISYIDTTKNLIYTATVADSEVNIYRKFGTTYKSIPLSVIRDWASPKEALRISKELQRPELAIDWPKAKNPKELRSSGDPELGGINMSRVIGDAHLSRKCPHVIHKPKITVQKLKAGDTIIAASDGLKDYARAVDINWQTLEHEAAIVEHVKGSGSVYDLATQLVNNVEQWNGAPSDDVTVVVVTAKAE